MQKILAKIKIDFFFYLFGVGAVLDGAIALFFCFFI
jgi:hypothetical protein